MPLTAGESLEQQTRALAGQRRDGAGHALDLGDGLVQALNGFARAAAAKDVALKTALKAQG